MDPVTEMISATADRRTFRRGSIVRSGSAIFPAMPEAQNEYRSVRDFVVQLVIADDDSPHLARIKRIQPLAKAGVIQQSVRCARQLLDDARRGIWGDGLQMFMEADKIAGGLAGPLNVHANGGASGSSVERLSAQATML
ncbi:hypothetical protein SPHV1_2280117 [Novosphingobium sp. KN65.2]|nr:hypothetical protein SPHV1_2280117 [Novosphingobium sp. KN65.2]